MPAQCSGVGHLQCPPCPQAAGESPGVVPRLTSPRSAGTLRVELLNQSSLDLLRYDDGPYEAGGEKDQDPSLIPVPANSYLGMGGWRSPGMAQETPTWDLPSLTTQLQPPLAVLPLLTPPLSLSVPPGAVTQGWCL